MIRSLPLIAAVALALPGAAGAATYAAKPAAPVAAKRILDRDIAWSCGPAACQGATEESRPLVLCQGLAKKAGRIDSFLVDGRAFGVAELAKCNASAKTVPAARGAAEVLARAN